MTEAQDYADHPPRPWPRLSVLGADLAVAYPLLLLGLLYSEWLLAWCVLGHPPRPSLDDPKDVPVSSWLGLVVGLAIAGFLPAWGMAAVLTGLHAMDPERRGRHLATQVAGLLLLWPGTIAWLRWDPFRVMEWWLD